MWSTGLGPSFLPLPPGSVLFCEVSMKCPNCQHTTSDTAILQCSQCGEAFERNLLEEYQHLEYLTRWLADRPELSFSQMRRLTDSIEKRKNVIIAQLLPKAAEADIAPEAE